MKRDSQDIIKDLIKSLEKIDFRVEDRVVYQGDRIVGKIYTHNDPNALTCDPVSVHFHSINPPYEYDPMGTVQNHLSGDPLGEEVCCYRGAEPDKYWRDSDVPEDMREVSE